MNTKHKGPIAWMANNHVAANLFMLILLIGGLIMLTQATKKEIFPEIDRGTIIITVPYPGASPVEVENGIILPVEEAIDGIDGIKEIRARALEGIGIVYADIFYDADLEKVASDIKNSIDRITTFPDDAEDPQVEVSIRKVMVIQLAVHGNIEEGVLKEIVETMRDDMLKYDNISQVNIEALRPQEIGIEVSLETLRRYGLTLSGIAEIVKRSAIEIPGGELKTEAGKILLRTNERRNLAKEFKDIIIIADDSGSVVKLGEIAEIKNSFEDEELFAFFDGERSAIITVYRAGKQTPVEVSDSVKNYMERAAHLLPNGVKADILIDFSDIYKDRIHLLVKNAIFGLILVLLLLSLFLQPSLAFWVTMGIPISFLGSFLFLPGFDISINMISLFAFIITLGIVVDDAIVVGDNIYEHRLKGDDSITASINGAREVSIPVIFSVLTTITAFAPMLFVQGDWGQVMRNIPLVVIIVLIISLFESLYILPAHLGHITQNKKDETGRLTSFRSWFTEGIIKFSNNIYGPMVNWTVRNRWQTLAISIAILIIAIGFVRGGFIKFTLMSNPEGDWVIATANMPFDAPRKDVFSVKELLEKSAHDIIMENGGTKISKGISAVVNSSNNITVTASFVDAKNRNISLKDFTAAWRKKVGSVPGVETLKFEIGKVGHKSGPPIDIQLTHNDINVLELASSEMAERLMKYPGVMDVDNGVAKGKPQIDFKLTTEGRSLGLTPFGLARQIRDLFYGIEAFSQQQGNNAVAINIKLPEDERNSIYSLNGLIIRTPSGGEIPLEQAAQFKHGTSYTNINRIDRKRIISVTGDIDLGITSVDNIVSSLDKYDLPELMEKYTGLNYVYAGEKKESKEAMSTLITGFLVALLLMYCLIAIPFKSYIQSTVVLLAIPFGFVGALFGHLIMGYNLSLMSMFGIVALSGVVINDSLVLVHKANDLRDNTGLPLIEAVQQAGIRRFRPIILTSLTTFFGLSPMIFETSIQARFLIPMALSLGFGVLFATMVTLLLVPAFYIIEVDIKEIILEILDDIKGFFKNRI